MYSSELILHLCGTILASAVALLALRLIPLTGKSKAWLLISTAVILMAIERVGELLAHAGMFGLAEYRMFADGLWIVIFALWLAGVLCIRAIFLELITAKSALVKQKSAIEKQLDELQRFHNVSIGRELRMKELFDENQALKIQLKEIQQ